MADHSQNGNATLFAPGERASLETLQRQYEFLQALPYVGQMLDSMPLLAMILNPERQIVFANKALLDFLTHSNALVGEMMPTFLGKRPGEAVSCLHSTEGSNGCGTGVACRNCGAVLAILASQLGNETQMECRMLRHGQNQQIEALDLRVTASPMAVKDYRFTILTIADISDEKRRLALERIFFHDILNTAGAVHGMVEVLASMDVRKEDLKSITGFLRFSSDRLIDEINAQRTLSSAERNELKVVPGLLEILPFLQQMASVYSTHTVALERFIRVAPDAENVTIQTDRHLLGRVVQNLIKNALEACGEGQSVTLGARCHNDELTLSVHNPDVMSEEVRNQIFNRSFSTRGPGRGLGTYSVKLLAERYLNGRVSFESAAPKGTCFYVTLPMAKVEEKVLV